MTPSFNQGQFIEETLRSVLLQKYPNLEYIVIDGGSTDGTLDILHKYSPFLTYWESKRDRGQSHAINKGWTRSTGALVTWLCSDDILLPGALAAASRELLLRPEADLVYAASESFGQGRPIRTFPAVEHDVRHLLLENYISQPTVLFRRELLDAEGLLNENLQFAFDYEYWLRAAARGPFVALDRKSARFRLHDASKTVSMAGQFRRERVRILDLAFDLFPELFADKQLVRAAYLDDLIYGAGEKSVFPPAGRVDAIARLAQLSPAPSKDEVLRVIRDQPHPTSDGASTRDGALSEGYMPVSLDPLQVVGPLYRHGIISRRNAYRIIKRLRAEAALKRHQDSEEKEDRVQTCAALLRSALLDPAVLFHIQWWEPARHTGLGRVLWPLFYGVRGLKRRLVHFSASRGSGNPDPQWNLRIAFVSHSSGLGGAEQCLLEAVHGLLSRGHHVSVVVPRNGPLLQRLRDLGAEVRVVHYSWWVSDPASHPTSYQRVRLVISHFGWAMRLARSLKALQPDVIVTNTVTVPGSGIAARLLRTPHVWYIHEFIDDEHGLTFDYGVRLSTSLMDRVSDLVLVNSTALARGYRRHFSEGKMRVVDPAIELATTAQWSSTQRDTLNLVLVGAVIPSKHPLDAIDAVMLLRDRGVTVHLTIVGPSRNGYDEDLRRYIESNRLNELVAIVPLVPNPQDFIAAADIAVVCSLSEGFGRATVEAMKLGKPVVGPATSATAGIIQHERTGFLYTPGKVMDLADKLAMLDGDRTLLAEVGARARVWSNSRFTLERFTDQFERALQETVAATRHVKRQIFR